MPISEGNKILGRVVVCPDADIVNHTRCNQLTFLRCKNCVLHVAKFCFATVERKSHRFVVAVRFVIVVLPELVNMTNQPLVLFSSFPPRKTQTQPTCPELSTYRKM